MQVTLELASALQTIDVTHDLLERRNRPGLRALSRRLGELVAFGWKTDELRDELLDGSFRDARSVMAVLLSRVRALPANPGSAADQADQQAEAMAREQRQRQLEAARAHLRNLTALEDVDACDLLGALQRYEEDAEAHRAAVSELLRLRPDAAELLTDVQAAS